MSLASVGLSNVWVSPQGIIMWIFVVLKDQLHWGGGDTRGEWDMTESHLTVFREPYSITRD